VQQALRDRDALVRVAVEQRVGRASHDGRELPAEVERVLQARVHALAAGGAVDVRGVAEQERATVAEPLGAAVVDPVGREPQALGERQVRAGVLADRRRDVVERDAFAPGELRRQDADHAPAILPAHREEQVEAAVRQVDVELVAHHAPGRDRVGDEEHVLVRRTGKPMPLISRTGLFAPSQPASHDAVRVCVLPSGRRSFATTPVGTLLERDELGPPAHVHAEGRELRAEHALVVVLAEHQDVRIGAQALADVAERQPGAEPGVGPQVDRIAFAAERDRLVDDAEPRVDLERARVDGDRARLLRGPGMAVDDVDADAAPRELAGEHQAGRARADDEHVDVRNRGDHTALIRSTFRRSVAPRRHSLTARLRRCRC
jgi:hypothetical protein